VLCYKGTLERLRRSVAGPWCDILPVYEPTGDSDRVGTRLARARFPGSHVFLRPADAHRAAVEASSHLQTATPGLECGAVPAPARL
jgi:hypothetical protein